MFAHAYASYVRSCAHAVFVNPADVARKYVHFVLVDTEVVRALHLAQWVATVRHGERTDMVCPSRYTACTLLFRLVELRGVRAVRKMYAM